MSSVPVPNVATPSRKITCPVGVPVAGATAVTFTVNVIDCPAVEGLAEDVITMLENWLVVLFIARLS